MKNSIHQVAKNKYEQLELDHDFMSISVDLIEEAKSAQIPIESDPSTLKHMIKNDLRDNMPSQLYALIGLVTSTIEKLEKNQEK